MFSTLAKLERVTATVLMTLATLLQRAADKAEMTPLSATCTRLTPKISVSMLTTMSGWQVAILASILAIFLVASLTFIFRLMGSTPDLNTVPPPTAQYDPDIDPQSDLFCDDDVRPQLVAPGLQHSLSCINPATGKTLGHVAGTSADEVTKIVERARMALLPKEEGDGKEQEGWATSSFERRRKVLLVLKNYILYEQKQLSAISSRDTGKTMAEASLGEILPSLEKLRWLIREGESALRSERRSVGPMAIHKVARVDYMPLGVIAAIAPWNYPLHNIINPVSAALFAGNAVVVKPSEHAAYSSAHFIRVIRRALAVCGENADLVQVVQGGPEIAKALVTADVDKVFFTGSTGVGRKVAAAAVNKLTPTCLELGGKDPLIICDDADVAHTLSLCMRAVFQNSGQNCIGIERVFVHKRLKQDFTEQVVKTARSIRVGVDMGAMTMGQAAIDSIQSLVDDAKAKGAKVLTGGKQAQTEDKGWYYAPTVLDGVTPAMRIAREEVFGPVLCIYEWDDDEELIKVVNECPFGLGSNVFTEDVKRGEHILSKLRVGMGNINDFASNYLCQSIPFGGTKESGSDRFAGIEGLRGCCVVKSTTRDRFTWLKTSVPKGLQYPVAENAAEFALEINDLVYGGSWLTKFDNVRNIIGMMFLSWWKPRSVGSG